MSKPDSRPIEPTITAAYAARWSDASGPNPGERSKSVIRKSFVEPCHADSTGFSITLVIVVPVTSTRWSLPSHVEIETGRSGLANTSYAKAEDVKSVSQERLVTRCGQASVEVVRQLEVVLRTLLEL